jgi:starch phosphorylase
VLDPDALTIVFARRFATYKRAWLLLSDPDRLLRLLHGSRPVQFVFAGKAHPRDLPGQEVLRRVASFAMLPETRARFVFLENYDVGLARTLVQGADVWLNVPRRPHEASGTSGMKAAANGALNLSILDGWWAEAWTDHNRMAEPIGWAVEGESPAGSDTATRDRADAEALYTLLEQDVVPLFHERGADGLPARWIERIRATLRQVAPYFSTHRMVREYVEELYLPGARTEDGRSGLREEA